MKKADTLKLDNQLCFLLYASSRKMTAAYAPLLTRIGLTYPQYLVMLVLWEKDAVDIGYLTEKLLLDTGTLSPLLKKMQKINLVTRERDSEDERRVIITLTAKGNALKKEALDIPQKIFKKSGLTEETYHTIMQKLSLLLSKLV